jgi:ribonuclease Z
VTWLVQPRLVNDPFSDPALFIDFRFGRRALLFDLGDVTPLSAREPMRVSHVFVSHTHMDHFAGFDRLLRLCLRRTAPLHLAGPPGFLDQVEHKLKAYNWNLLDAESLDFRLTVAEFDADRIGRVGEFRAREAFQRRELSSSALPPRTLLEEDEFRIESVVLDHGTPCLAFAFQETLRINVWKEGLDRLRLPVGPWLNEAKRAVRHGAPDDSAIHIHNESALEQSEDPLSPADIAEATGMARNNPDKWAEDERLSRVGQSAPLDMGVHLARRRSGFPRQADRR